MKISSLLALVASLGAASSAAAPTGGLEAVKRANFPGLDAVQTANARAIIDETNRRQLGSQGCIVAITAALTEVCAPRHPLPPRARGHRHVY